MEINYLCPSCRSFLNIGTRVVLSIQSKDNQKGLLMFEKTLGDYEVKKHDLIHYTDGDLIGFFCPMCHESLSSKLHEHLAKVIMVDENDQEYDIFFSKIAGEKATYKINNGNVEAFGVHKEKYLEMLKKIAKP